ncbi:hypothetical protein D3C80_1756310 [compost metagenome]
MTALQIRLGTGVPDILDEPGEMIAVPVKQRMYPAAGKPFWLGRRKSYLALRLRLAHPFYLAKHSIYFPIVKAIA